MPESNSRINGQLLHASTRESLIGLSVDASYKQGNRVLLTQNTLTEDDGQYTLEFTPDIFANLTPNDSISVDFEVFHGEQRLALTRRIDRLPQKDVKVEILVQLASPKPYLAVGRSSLNPAQITRLTA